MSECGSGMELLAAEEPAVLLIDDNEDNQEIYRAVLEHAGYRVLQAWDGEEGVLMARRCLPGLILMDIAMPRVDGWHATRTLKADPATAAIPILALTALALPAERALAEGLGYADYLTKPIEPREVLACVSRILGEPRRG